MCTYNHCTYSCGAVCAQTTAIADVPDRHSADSANEGTSDSKDELVDGITDETIGSQDYHDCLRANSIGLEGRYADGSAEIAYHPKS